MIKNKKILMLCTTDNMIWQFLLPHINYLKEQGNEIICACAKTGFWFDELKEKHSLNMKEFDFSRSPFSFKNFKLLKQLKKYCKEECFDLVYCQQPVGGLMGRLIAKKFNIPCIYTAHGFHFFKGNSKIKNFVFKTVEKYLSKYTTALITINEEDYQAALKFKAKKVYKINGIGFDLNKYKEQNKPKEEIRKELGINNEFCVLTVAEFIERKNYSTMLKTIAELKNQNIKYLICGSGKDKQQIENRIKELEIENNVILLGYRKDINNIMIASDCYFLASHQEGLTLSIIEALNFGLPVLTSNVRGNKDLIENNKGGFVCEQNDYLGFSNALHSLIKNKELRELMSKENLRNSSKYKIQAVLEQLQKIYEEFD